jgi:hypothetical protein
VSSESLGPKPTAKQMETLRKLCGEGMRVSWMMGIRCPDSAWLIHEGDMRTRETFRTDTLYKFRTWGWIIAIGDPAYAWRGNTYVITEKGRKVVELGVVRK